MVFSARQIKYLYFICKKKAAVNDKRYLFYRILGAALYTQIVNDKQVILVKAGDKICSVLGELPCQAVQDGGKVYNHTGTFWSSRALAIYSAKKVPVPAFSNSSRPVLFLYAFNSPHRRRPCPSVDFCYCC